VKLPQSQLTDLTATGAERVHRAVDSVVQLIPDREQQFCTVLTIVKYLLSIAVEMISKEMPREQAIEVIIDDIRDALKD
jgi:hypothetical protein